MEVQLNTNNIYPDGRIDTKTTTFIIDDERYYTNAYIGKKYKYNPTYAGTFARANNIKTLLLGNLTLIHESIIPALNKHIAKTRLRGDVVTTIAALNELTN